MSSNANANNNNTSSDDNNNTSMMPPPPLPKGVSLSDRTMSMPAASLPARHLPSEPRSVSFSDSVSFNFPVDATASSGLPGRIVSQVTARRSSLESIQDFGDLSFSSLSSLPEEFKPTASSKGSSSDDPLLEPHQVFDSKPSAANFSTCSGDDLRTVLHRACQQFPRKKAMVKGALKKDPSAVRRRAFIPGVPTKATANSGVPAPPEPYQLPINIALAHKASVDVLDLLVKADATQLAAKDGIHGSNSLCLALEKRPNDIAVLGMFLVSNPRLIREACDNHDNTPLHVACQRGSALPIVRQLFRLYPAALFHRNESNKTPLDILQQHATVCPKAKTTLKYLQEKASVLAQQQQQQQQQQGGGNNNQS